MDCCLIVDDEDKPIDSMTKLDAHKINPLVGKCKLHRAFSLFIIDSDDNVLIQKRANKKITFPGLWGNSCCSHFCPKLKQTFEEVMLDPNDYVNQVARRAAFELGLKLSNSPIFITRFKYSADSGDGLGENEIDYIYGLRETRIRLALNPDEVADAKWIPMDDLGKHGTLFTPWIIALTSHQNWHQIKKALLSCTTLDTQIHCAEEDVLGKGEQPDRCGEKLSG